MSDPIASLFAQKIGEGKCTVRTGDFPRAWSAADSVRPAGSAPFLHAFAVPPPELRAAFAVGSGFYRADRPGLHPDEAVARVERAVGRHGHGAVAGAASKPPHFFGMSGCSFSPWKSAISSNGL